MTKLNQPLGGNEMPRFGGTATMMRLPNPSTPEGLDACFVGIPMDIGTSWRSGTRFGPRAIRAESCLLRPFNVATGAAPFDSLQIADVGDVAIDTFNLPQSAKIIREAYANLLKFPVRPITLGGDHSLTFPILQSVAEKHGPVALIHVDAHADVNDTMFGEPIAHGTTFRRAYEAGAIIPELTFQIGLRGTGYSPEDLDWSRDKGFTVIPADHVWGKDLTGLMAEIREKIGRAKAYVSFDIDALDPSVAPGTGTPEIGGLTSWQGLQIVRGCKGLDVVGADVVEVSPPYDPSGNTALAAANIAFELLCVLPGVKYN
ncbi:agmatinase [Rhizobium sp. CCGE 510]|nr:agmatinase [Rhizobium sp. CCGE 510]EJT04266.1 agmatinase [Rhizobium sp. CCGE 510]